LKSEGRKDGADFSNWKWWPNTLKAHQLVQFCESNGISSADHVNALLFRAEYERGENISLVDVLVRIGQEASDGSTDSNKIDDLRKYLTEDEGKAQLEQEISHGRRKYRVSSVPYFLISADEDATDDKKNRPRQRPYGLSGAQSSDTFVELFKEIAEQQ
jgi:predicted DsbA family dithiol-disulfide isomerase